MVSGAVTDIRVNRFGFMLGRSTMELNFILRQIVEEHRATKRRVHVACVDLKNAYDLALMSKIWDAMRCHEVHSS